VSAKIDSLMAAFNAFALDDDQPLVVEAEHLRDLRRWQQQLSKSAAWIG
jgi:hypothetical protein